MSVISEAGVFTIVSVEAVAPGTLLVVDLGFLFCESLVEAVLVLVGAAMDEGVKEEEDTGRGDGYTRRLYTSAFATWRNMK